MAVATVDPEDVASPIPGRLAAPEVELVTTLASVDEADVIVRLALAEAEVAVSP